MKMLAGLLENKVLLTALIAWGLAQGLKLPIMSFIQRRLNWSVLFSAGGMPSSHAALITSCANAIGLWQGYNSPLFALSTTIAIIVLYDATGVRHQAGIHAARINFLFQELLQGHSWNEEELREVLGHTPLEVLAGTLLGIAVSTLIWVLWR